MKFGNRDRGGKSDHEHQENVDWNICASGDYRRMCPWGRAYMRLYTQPYFLHAHPR